MNASTDKRRARRGLGLLLAAGALFGPGCSSGLEGLDAKGSTGAEMPAESTNLRFAFDPCVALTAPISAFEVAGGVIPEADGARERPVAFFTFVTRSVIADADDGTSDVNGVEDVFVAAIDSQGIDPNAFSYSIAGTMRHTRCVTCHQMNVDVVQDPDALPPLPFLTQGHFPEGGGEPPLNEFNDESCKGCHFPDWFSPGPTFDLRRVGTMDLFIRAQVPPGGLGEHFRTDPRVLWALDRGDTPFGGAADDDHDGVDEPEDHDGVRRHAPGGKKKFLERLDGWLDTADPVSGELKFSSAADAVQDIVLASRALPGNQSGDGASQAPSAVYEPNPAFDPGDPTLAPAGFLHVAFQSDASDMVAGTLGGFTDVFRVTIDVLVTVEGKVDLAYRPGSQVCVSLAVGGADSEGHATDPDIGANGQRVAFVSEAFDLVAGLPEACRPEVYLFDQATGIALVSNVPGNPLQPGDAGAIRPDLSPDGQAVAFESDATNLVPLDTNGARDVFFALWPALEVERASVTDDGGEFSGHSHGASLFHAGGDVRVAFACQEAALPPVLGVQCPDERVTLTASRDTHLREGRGSADENTNFGASDLQVGTTGSDPNNAGESRTLIAFDLTPIPAGATINSASLKMRVNTVPAGGGTGGCGAGGVLNNATLHVLAQDWVESEATWLNRSAGIPWSSAGATGDFDPTSSALTQLTAAMVVYEWSDPVMAADVQSWLDSGANFGWLVTGEDVDCSVKRIDSREDTLLPAQPPTLTIDYTPPLPRVAGLGAAGASSVFVRDTALARTLDLNQAVVPAGTIAARELDVDGTPLLASATNPVISPEGNAVLFETMAQNLDVVRPFDENRLMDVVLVDLLQFESQGFVLPYHLSVTADGGNANGPSHSPRFGAFTPPTDAFPLGLAAYATNATNLGDSDPGDLNGDGVPEADNFMLSFLSEGASVLADFAAVPARQGMGRSVAFASRSSGQPDTFLWDFGDGSPTSSARSPSHVYTTPGRYTVQLTVSGELGSDERTRIEYVHVLDAVMATFSTTKDTRFAPLQAPAVDVPFTDPLLGAIDDADPASVLLLDLSSAGSSEFPEQFSWTLTRVDGAGNPLGASTTVAAVANPQDVAIDTTGRFDLRLQATGAGGSGTATQRIEVFQRVAAAFTTDPSGTPVRGPAELVVQFTDASSGAVAEDGHFWQFGDGTTSTEASPLHSYAEGVYFAFLTVSGQGTDSDSTLSFPVVADGPITAVFEVVPLPAGSLAGFLAGEAIDDGSGVLADFVNLSQDQDGDPLFYLWEFGTGAPTGQETVQDPSGILYLSDGENVSHFPVQLVTSTIDPAPPSCVGQPAGTCDERLGHLSVFPRPVASFAPPGPSFSSAPSRPPHTVQLDGTVVGDGLGTDPVYRWRRSEANGTGATLEFASGLAPEVEFLDPGTYEVVLEVETNGPDGTRQTVQSEVREVFVRAATLTEWYTQAVAPASGARCTNCHKGANPPAGLNWLGTPAEVFQRIVADAQGNPVFSTRCNSARRRIEPFDPENSAVYNVLLKPPGPLCSINMRVNLPGEESDKDAHVAVLRSWILGGALDD